MLRRTHMPTRQLNRSIIEAAIEGFQAQRARIDQQTTDLRQMLDGGSASPAPTPETAPGKRKKFSATARKRMKEAQQRRWAKIRGAAEPSVPATPELPKAKRRISEE